MRGEKRVLYGYICSLGQYQDEIGRVECKLCPTGTFGNVRGSKSADAGIKCPKGQRNPSPGNSKCFACPPLFYQGQTGEITCKRCPTGTSTTAFGSADKSDCVEV